MASHHRTDLNFRFDTIPAPTKEGLELLKEEKWLHKEAWYLAGGTALALQAGHRKSHDLDFFTPKAEFTLGTIVSRMEKFEWKSSVIREGTIYGELNGSKVSFLAYPHFVAKEPFLKYGHIPVLATNDIAVMKIVAISQRGTKRDFYDLYWCAHHVAPLEALFPRLKDQYPKVAHNYHHILKSMTYFEDAETEPEPEILFDATWPQVKTFFSDQLRRIGPDILELTT